MDQDIISNTLINDETVKTIKKLYRFSFVFIALVFIYTLSESIYLYVFYRDANISYLKGFKHFYFYWIFPFSGITTLFFELCNSIFIWKGYGLMVQSIENNDPILFNKSFNKFYTSMLFALISGIIGTINVVLRYLIYK